MALSLPFFLLVRFMGGACVLLLALLALEAPAAAHFGAAHVDLPKLAAPVDQADNHSVSEAALTATDACGEDGGRCTSSMMHAHCHPPAVLAARADLHRLASVTRASWSLSPAAAIAVVDGTPPVPPPNAA